MTLQECIDHKGEIVCSYTFKGPLEGVEGEYALVRTRDVPGHQTIRKILPAELSLQSAIDKIIQDWSKEKNETKTTSPAL